MVAFRFFLTFSCIAFLFSFINCLALISLNVHNFSAMTVHEIFTSFEIRHFLKPHTKDTFECVT